MIFAKGNKHHIRRHIKLVLLHNIILKSDSDTQFEIILGFGFQEGMGKNYNGLILDSILATFKNNLFLLDLECEKK